jgi:formylglycine-generating enzyme required for sulfatase activity
MKHRMLVGGCLAVLALLAAGRSAEANNITVGTPVLWNPNLSEKYAYVRFDMQWENSWRTDLNWDAAWVFVKFRPVGSNNWQHATLDSTNGNHVAAAGSAISATTDGRGVFVSRSSNGSGNVSYTQMKLRWNYGADGYTFARGDPIEVSVQAIEMVYVPQSSFFLGSGGTENSHFCQYTDGSQETNAYLVSSEAAITCGSTYGSLYAAGGVLPSGVLSNEYPKGYSPYYSMKYKITQGQYADFLNKLTSTQSGNRFPNAFGSKGHTISGSYTNYSATAPDRASNYLCYMDVAAYADWSGLRPMTELEYEKSCRGSELPVAGEYAWGSTAATQITGVTGTDGSGTEKASPTTANCLINSLGAPVRVGIFATNGSTRVSSGASYYGIMELSGNIYEWTVSAGVAVGRTFRGTHGDGQLSVNGHATNSDWPGYNGAGEITGVTGAGIRPTRYPDGGGSCYVSTRGNAQSDVDTGRGDYGFGWGGRCVRSAP